MTKFLKGIRYSGPETIVLRQQKKAGGKQNERNLEFVIKSVELAPLWDAFTRSYAHVAQPLDPRQTHPKIILSQDRIDELNLLNDIAFTENGLAEFLRAKGMAESNLAGPAQKHDFEMESKPLIRVCDACSLLTTPDEEKKYKINFRPLNKALMRVLISQWTSLKKQAIADGADFNLQTADGDNLPEAARIRPRRDRKAFLQRPDTVLIKEALWHLNRNLFEGTATNIWKRLNREDISYEEAATEASRFFNRSLFTFREEEGIEFSSYVVDSMQQHLRKELLKHHEKHKSQGRSLSGKSDDFGILDTRADERMPSPEAAASLNEQIGSLNMAIGTLSPFEQDIYRMRHGLAPYSRPATFKAIGEKHQKYKNTISRRLERIEEIVRETILSPEKSPPIPTLGELPAKAVEPPAIPLPSNGRHPAIVSESLDVKPITVSALLPTIPVNMSKFTRTFKEALQERTAGQVTADKPYGEFPSSLAQRIKTLRAATPIHLSPSEDEGIESNPAGLVHEIAEGAHAPSSGLAEILIMALGHEKPLSAVQRAVLNSAIPQEIKKDRTGTPCAPYVRLY